MVPFSIAFKSGFYAIFKCLSVSKKKFILSKCQSAKYAGSMLATSRNYFPGIISTLIGEQTKES